ncbi:class I SAM-dependent methyltransferase [Sphaerotilus microaerophilus]|uniref:Methyltransferase type 12 n=1 Tax=Sphaerotilus microaerophilus TaxID=2914710 RepID=A0ABM7YJC8_9BURK|nr:class I SAM-dependent methyltransferase [Sphaerotilus sp. FB-5]BDI04441.1 hypothetical protein CATMQ487_14110 [Sphaerotilus sp. FB-5]
MSRQSIPTVSPLRPGARLTRTGDSTAAAANDSPLRSACARLRWPLPALLTWATAWGLFTTLQQLGVATAAAMAAALLLGGTAGLGTGLAGHSRWRGWIVAVGFPLSWGLHALLHGLAVPAAGLGSTVAAGGVLGELPAWAWLVPLALFLLAYPLRAWHDAPFFPTPSDALEGLADIAPLPARARILDAGCGLGHGLQALRRAYPSAQLQGVEWSWPLRWLASLRCRWAHIRRGDMWAQSWSGHDMVYLFQRPESMAHAAAKARQEMRPGSWLVSLEFKAPGLRLHAVLQREDARPVWVYAIGPAPRRG